jgi:hypothetical protein
LSLDAWPLTIFIADFLIPNSFERTSTSCAFAAPSAGGAVSLTLSEPSTTPSMPLRDERGCTLTKRDTVPLSDFLTAPAKRDMKDFLSSLEGTLKSFR